MSKGLSSLSENLFNDFERFKLILKRKPNLDFDGMERAYLIQTGNDLWTLFDNYKLHLDLRLLNIIGDCKSEINFSCSGFEALASKIVVPVELGGDITTRLLSCSG